MKTNFLKIKFLSCSALLFFACACGVEDEKTQDVQPIGSEAHGGGGVRGEFLSLRHTFHGLLEDPQILSIIKKYCEWGEQFRSTAELKEAYLRRVTETPLSLTVVKLSLIHI